MSVGVSVPARCLLVGLVLFCFASCTGVISAETDVDASNRDALDIDGGSSAEPMPETSLRIAVVSDLNDAYGATSYGSAVSEAVSAIIAEQPDIVLSTGDMVAGQMAGLNYDAMWSAFHSTVSDRFTAAGLPFAVTPGNHDGSGYAGFSAERAVYVDQWSGRRPAIEFLDDTHYPLRYSFVVNGALFVALDDSTIGSLGAEQMTWLERELARPAQSKIVFGHVPLYGFSQGRESEVIGDPALEAMLNAAGVDLFVSGHHHAYYPGKRSELRLVSTACLGAGPRKLIGDDALSRRSYLMIEIDQGQITSLEAHAIPGSAIIARDTLPASVGTGDRAITRDDL